MTGKRPPSVERGHRVDDSKSVQSPTSEPTDLDDELTRDLEVTSDDDVAGGDGAYRGRYQLVLNEAPPVLSPTTTP